jgi:predicted flap endonuclease-1-like 5' DNA nuclease
MSPWLILLLIIVVVLVIWWALLRNAKGYQPDFPMHHDEGHAEHGTEGEAATHGAVVEQAEEPALRADAAQVEAAMEAGVLESETGAAHLPPTTADVTRDDASPYAAAAAIAQGEPVEPLAPEAPRGDLPGMVEGAPVEAAGQPSEHPAAAPEAAHMASPSVQPDDLIIIEGIGPKVNQVLQAAGIYTFAQLADTTPEQLKAILEPAGFRFMDPSSWPQQARLAGDGKMEELKALQKNLNAGKTV